VLKKQEEYFIKINEHPKHKICYGDAKYMTRSKFAKDGNPDIN